MEFWVGAEILAFCSGYNEPILFFEIYKRGLYRARSVALSKHVTHYGPRSGFPYYDLTTPQREGLPYPPPGDALGCSVGRALGTLPVWSLKKKSVNTLQLNGVIGIYLS